VANRRVTREPGAAFTWRDRLRYRIDTTFSSGTGPLILWLAILTFLMVLLAAVVLALLHVAASEGDRSFREAMWASLLRAIDPGTMGSDAGWSFRLVSLSVTIGGIFIVSTLIGLIATGLDRKLESLREGRGLVVEVGHTLILGWSPTLPGIVAELAVANDNLHDACVVVLAQRDKAAMEQDIRSRVPDLRTTRLVCRTGDPSDPVDLGIVNPLDAKAVVLLSQDGAGDASVIRSVLALMSHDPGLAGPPVIAEVKSAKTAHSLRRVTHGKVISVVSDEVIGRIAAQVCRHRGLSAVYQELLDFDGDEVYFADADEFVGRPFADLLLASEESSVIGLRRATGETIVGPSMTLVVESGDAVVAISEDDDTVRLDAGADAAAAPTRGLIGEAHEQEHILVLGWSALGPVVLRELDHYVAPGSTVHVVVDPGHASAPDPVFAGLVNLEVRVTAADHHDPDCVVALLEAEQPDHLLLLCYRDGLAPAEADAAALMALLQVRHCLDRWPAERVRPSVVAELLDPRDIELARVTGADDFVVSERLTSLLLAQLAENPALDPVFGHLLDVEGAEITLRPVERFGDPVALATYGDLVRAGIDRDEIVIGFCARGATPVAAAGVGLGGGIVLNAPKSAPLHLAAGDEVVVVTRSRSAAPVVSPA
jgi:voltage-gated potassium channel Kch